jgi:hypothetical protein
MSQQLISRNPDLARLRNEGYDVSIRVGHLVVDRIPYVRSPENVGYGTLISELTLQGDKTTRPGSHVVHFAGDYPCDQYGKPLAKIRHQSTTREIGDGLTVNHSFSSKPPGGYADHYEKMATYAAILATPAALVDGTMTATPFPVIVDDTDDSVFRYVDTASSRAGIANLNERLAGDRVAIIGLGGTGSYVLDLVAKTPVQEIHLFDDDNFLTHNAFRSPGVATINELRSKPTKVDYFASRYKALRTHIVPHACRLDSSNVISLDNMSIVFLCLDDGEAKRPIIEHLEQKRVQFIDAGLGVLQSEDKLLGIVRVTTSTPNLRRHVHEKHRIPLIGTPNNEYSTNIQIAELNALNAALAVIKWKKLRDFYLDLEGEHHTTYTIDGNAMTNEDKVGTDAKPEA